MMSEKAANEVELQEAAVEAARAAVGYRQAELATAEARLLQTSDTDTVGAGCCIDVLAPSSGTVLAVKARSEQAIAAGAVIAEIGDVSQLEIVVDLLSSDAIRVVPGTPTDITEWGGDKVLQARVRKIDPAAFTKVSALGIEEQRVSAVLDLVDSDARLGHAFRVVAELVVWSCESCLQVPISALYRSGDEWQAFAVVDGRAQEKPVQLAGSMIFPLRSSVGSRQGTASLRIQTTECLMVFASASVSGTDKALPLLENWMVDRMTYNVHSRMES